MQTARCSLLFILALLFLTFPLVGNAQNALQFIPVTPCRIVDTRPQYGGKGPIQGGTAQNFSIQGNQGGCSNIPATAAAYSLNVTVVPQGTLGYLTVWPSGQAQPNVSTLNSVDGRIKANAAIVGAGSGGQISVFATNTTNLVLDLDGYFEATPTNDPVLAFYPLAPCRVLDTRKGQSLQGGQQYAFPVTGLCNVPSTATAYSLNFTAVPHQPLGYLTVWPAGQSKPVASILNAPTGTVTANAGIIPMGSVDGNNIDVFATNDTDLVIDVNGYFAPATSAVGGLSLFTLTPCRALDTRHSSGKFSGTLPVDAVVSSCGLPSTAQTVVVNATVVPPGLLGYLTMWANGQKQPNASTLNAVDGVVTSNMAVVPLSNGYINAFASNQTQLIVDLFNYFAIPSGLNGNYTFTINGYNMPNGGAPLPCSAGGQLMIAGSFIADGMGNISSGVFDLNCSGGTPLAAVPFTGKYSIQPNGLGTMTVTLGVAGNPHFDLSVAISSTGNGRLILNSESNSYPPNAWGTGAISMQNPAALSLAQVAGAFASGFSGADPSLNRYAGAGQYLINAAGTVTGSGYILDNGNQVPVLAAGQLETLDPTLGRGAAVLISNGLQTNWVYYVTSANELTLLEVDPLTAKGANLVLQTMLRQSTTTFDPSYLNGVGVIRTSGLSLADKRKRPLQFSGPTDVVLGLFTSDGNGNYNVSLDENSGGTLTQQQTSQGTLSVASNGLVTFIGSDGKTKPLPVFYLVDKNEAFELGSILGSVGGQDLSGSAGFMAPQSGAPFSNSSGIGAYWGGNYMPVTIDVSDSVSWVLADGNGNLNGTNVTSDSTGVGGGNFIGTYSIDATGRMTLTENGKVAAILYVISPTRVALLPAAGSDPSVQVLGSTN